MTVPYELPIDTYIGNGVNTTYYYTFLIEDQNDLVAWVEQQLQVNSVDYSVDSVGDGGSITFAIAPQDGSKVTLYRDSPAQRLVDYQPNGPFTSVDLNEDFDRLWREFQDHIVILNNCVHAGNYDEPARLVLPNTSLRANKLLAFDQWGNVVLATNSQIYINVGSPLDNNGNNNDIYIDTSNWTFYQKQGDTWVVIGTIAGAAGAIGPPGVSVVSASLNDAGHLIILMSDSSLVDAGSVLGPQGIQGIQGVAGATGSAGQGVPTGGLTGQILYKTSDVDYQTAWENSPSNSITLTGDITGTGSGTITTTLADTGVVAGTYNSVTFNRKGVAISGSNQNIAGEFYVETPSAKTYPLLSRAPKTMIINSVYAKTSSGTITAAVKINGTNVTGLSAVAVTSTGATTNASGANTVNIGDRITLVTSSNSSAADLELTINAT